MAETGNVNTRISEARTMESGSAAQTGSQANLVSAADNSGAELIKTQATEINKREDKTTLINNSSQLKKGELNIGKSNNKNKVSLTNLEPLGAIYLTQSALVDAKPNHNLFDLSEFSALLRAEKINKKSDRFFVKIGSGINYVDKKLNATTYPDYVSRRNSEEDAAIYSSFNLHFGWKKQRFSLATGLEMNQYGEEIKFNNWLIGDVESINSNLVYFNDSSLNSVSYYIQGNEFTQTNFTYVTDSSIVYDTTLSKGQISQDLSQFSGRSMLSYFEIPIILNYTLYSFRSIEFSINGGLSLGLLRESRGYYLNQTLNELTDISKSDMIRKAILNGRVGVALHWKIGRKSSLFLQPEYRFNLQSTLNNSSEVNQRYLTAGLQFGLIRRF